MHMIAGCEPRECHVEPFKIVEKIQTMWGFETKVTKRNRPFRKLIAIVGTSRQAAIWGKTVLDILGHWLIWAMSGAAFQRNS